MAVIETSICIRKPIGEVFAAATTPALWPKWNTLCLKVTGGNNYPATEVGAKISEYVQIGKWQGQILWTVRVCKEPLLWLAKGEVNGSAIAVKQVSLKRLGDMTVMDHTYDYEFVSSQFGPIDRLFIRHRLDTDLEESLNRLKLLLEKNGHQDLGASRSHLLSMY